MHYYILAASKHRVRLLEVDHTTITDRTLDSFPENIDAVWKGMERQEQSVQSHSTGPGGTNIAYHGQGGAKDVEEIEEDRYYHSIAKALEAVLSHGHLPVVFAGVDEAFGMIRSFLQSVDFLDTFVHGNADALSAEELRIKAEPIVIEHATVAAAGVLEQFDQLSGTGRTSTELSEIEAAAAAGKVETLLITASQEEALASLLTEVRSHRGHVLSLPEGAVPGGHSIAAILRF